MRESKVTQGDLAAELGCSQVNVSRMLSGKNGKEAGEKLEAAYAAVMERRQNERV